MQTRAERTRRRLVLAGAELFDRDGYASATLGQIATTAGVTKGALYFHFASKGELADAVQEQGRLMLCEYVEERWLAVQAPIQVLIDLTHWLALGLHEDPVIRASCRITSERAGRESAATDFHQVWIRKVLLLLERAQQAGDLRGHLVEDGPQTLLSAAVCGIEVLAGSGLPYPELRRRVGALWESLLPALVPPGDTGRYRTAEGAAAQVAVAGG